MPSGKIVLLGDRGVVSVTGTDARAFLDNMITNDMPLAGDGDKKAVFAGLLSPQGKILFEYIVVMTDDGYLLDTQRATAADLAKRLSMYKLRSKVEIRDISVEYVVCALVGGDWPGTVAGQTETLVYRDPRAAGLGWRWIVSKSAQQRLVEPRLGAQGGDALPHYEKLRIALAIPEGGKDYPLGDTFPHEANWDLIHAVSFTKGCYVGQEVVARMQNKAVVRKRVVRISGSGMASGTEIKHGNGVVGSIGTVAADAATALAMLRLDRAVEALDAGETLLCDGRAITPDFEALKRYRNDVANRPVIKL